MHLVSRAGHISDHDLERYYLGMVVAEAELARLEEHLMWCHRCVERAEETQDYVDAVRAEAAAANLYRVRDGRFETTPCGIGMDDERGPGGGSLTAGMMTDDMGTTGKTLCDTDFVAWTEETARLIRERHFHEIDLEHLADEIQHLGKNQRDAARSHLQRMLLHLIRQRIQPELAGSSWRSSITSDRAEIEPKLESSPSLKRYLEASLERIYESAVRDAIYEMRISRSRAGEIPAACPWTLDELLEGEPE